MVLSQKTPRSPMEDLGVDIVLKRREVHRGI